jgi:hypothetical protein
MEREYRIYLSYSQALSESYVYFLINADILIYFIVERQQKREYTEQVKQKKPRICHH